MRTSCIWLAAAAVLLAPSASFADLTPPNHHSQTHNVRFDFGPYADYAAGIHVVVAGDTYQKIAKAKLGDLKRWTGIAKLNPQVEPTKLAVGSRLLLPPRKQPLDASKTETVTGARHQWSFFVVQSLPNKLVPLAHDQQVPAGRYGTDLFAVRQDQLASFRSDVSEHPQGARAVLAALGDKSPAWFARVKKLRVGYSTAPDRDPIHRVERHVRVDKIAGGLIELKEVSAKYFDGEGKELTAAQVAKAKSQWNFVLLFLGLAGVVGLYLVARRRSRPSISPVA